MSLLAPTAAAGPEGQHPVARHPLAVTWHSFDLRTGTRGQQLAVQANGNPSRILCTATELELIVRIWERGAELPGWYEATLPGRTMIVALDENETPIWGGMVYRRISTGSSWATLSTVTLEAYFDRRYVKDHSYTLTSQTVIADGVIGDATTDGVELIVDAASSFRLQDRQYFEDEDKTVLAALQELVDVEAGIEYTIDLSWADETRSVLERIVRIADRIGTGSAAPTASFSMPGSVTDFSYIEDYSADNGANAVQAISSGEGDSRPESKWMTAVVPGWVRYERKITPSTSITDPAVLDLHARAEVLQTWDGMNELTLEAHADTAPRIGTDWHLGDDVGVTLTCPRFPERMDADGAVVPGYQAVVRAVGWELDLEARRIKPRLLEAQPVDVEEL